MGPCRFEEIGWGLKWTCFAGSFNFCMDFTVGLEHRGMASCFAGLGRNSTARFSFSSCNYALDRFID